MCGLTGFLDATLPDLETGRARVSGMTATLSHRGPDAGDIWLDEAAGIALGHRRLSIVDLTEAGAQPMHSACGRYVIAYNGEIYNAGEIRERLGTAGAGRAFRGHSDTEVLLEACARWGVAEAVSQTIGMFAFALWDREARTLWLVRDRLGIKPLYWSACSGRILFGSELKALRAHPACPSRIDRQAVAAYLRFNYVPAPLTIYEGVNKLEPGTILELRQGTPPRAHKYWSLRDVAAQGLGEPWTGSDADAQAHLEELLSDAVRRRMIADVPLGAFLSGGIDSSLVAALMQAQSTNQVRTFSIGFHEQAFNEATHAKAVATHLGTDHTEHYVSPAEAESVIPMLPGMYDEPFGDASQIPTYLVSRMTRRHVTVALSGDGGDELFCGYRRYFDALAMSRVARVPLHLRRAAAAGIRMLPPAAWDALLGAAPSGVRARLSGHRLHRAASALGLDRDGTYRLMMSHWDMAAEMLGGISEAASEAFSPNLRETAPDFRDRMQLIDMMTYLPDDILTKVDRASMSVSLEARVPLIDHRVVELSWRLPRHLKVKPGPGVGEQGKWILRRILARHVPEHLFDRPKMGFGIPIGDWISGPLRDWAEDLLSERALSDGGLLDPAPVRARWQAHLQGRQNWEYPLWTILQFQAWRRAHPDAQP